MSTVTQKQRTDPGAASRPGALVDADLLPVLKGVEQFLYLQADLLDGKKWQDFIDLFAHEGIYWMPPAPHYSTYEGQPSIFYEDRDLMTVRAKRIAHPHAWSQAAEWGTNHVVSNVSIKSLNKTSGDVKVTSRFHMVELRRDNLRHFAGRYEHDLRLRDGRYEIVLQRVDMVNAQAPFDYVLQAWV